MTIGQLWPRAGANNSHRYVQVTASNLWDITHSLGFRPNVTAVDSAGDTIIPEVRYLSDTQVRLIFSAAVAGEAYLS